METKTCTKCRQELPLAAFYKDSTKYSGYMSRCRTCIDNQKKERYARDQSKRQALADYGKARRASIAAKKPPKPPKPPRILDLERIRLQRKQQMKRYKNKNPEAFLVASAAAQRRHYEKHPERKKYAGLRRRSLGPRPKPEFIAILWQRQQGLCVICRKSLGSSPKDTSEYHLDHIQPISKGGTNEAHNLQCLCPSCNLRKGAKLPHEFAQELGRLFI